MLKDMRSSVEPMGAAELGIYYAVKSEKVIPLCFSNTDVITIWLFQKRTQLLRCSVLRAASRLLYFHHFCGNGLLQHDSPTQTFATFGWTTFKVFFICEICCHGAAWVNCLYLNKPGFLAWCWLKLLLTRSHLLGLAFSLLMSVENTFCWHFHVKVSRTFHQRTFHHCHAYLGVCHCEKFTSNSVVKSVSLL